MITYLNPQDVSGVIQTDTPYNRSVSGYGSKLPTSWKVRIQKRWYRVYVVCWSNSGSAYVKVGKEKHYLGSWEPRDFVTV